MTNDRALLEFVAARPVGTGVCFVETGNEVWLIRGSARLGRYTILTRPLKGSPTGTHYTVIDWLTNERGILAAGANISSDLGRSGDSQGMRDIMAFLEKRTNAARLTKLTPVKIAEVVTAIQRSQTEAAKAFGGEVVHLGGLPRLTGSDRCDRCGARAYVAVRLKATGQRLDFCGHHYAEHAVDLCNQVDTVVDQRSELAA